ncbi:tetratricopeptide repeat protein [Gammaproteobacteria bacterium]|jgi:predicted negative regulator of RcsB-dependent stress response|nr:tetratricopeptide repeat protein [Gammaproteobacteria bacterium]MDC1149228.1 tetratricopeptide repeat protein [Gammaproteobacteria bacterium]|tara:strand:+ start:1282 stop:1923 length:642 start_codon:yes stop_codon:yes gene_type:complete
MNEVYEHNAGLASVRNFYEKYRSYILVFTAILIIAVSSFIILNQLSKVNNEKAAKIYNDWIAQEIETEEGQMLSDKLFNELIDSYKNTGYTKVALLNQASSYARLGELTKSLEFFKLLIDITDGIGGNDLFNKIARVNAARLLYVDKNYDSALQMIEKYSSSSSPMIHELSGDILNKQEKTQLAKEQYLLAKEQYSDETSISIVAMKISNLSL